MSLAYNWDGDIIVRDMIVPGKRYVAGNTRKTIDTDVREWIAIDDNNVMKTVLSEIDMPLTRKPGDFDNRALAIWGYVNKKIRYTHDSVKGKNKDFWLFPEETLTLEKGDCDDYSFLMASLLLTSGISSYCVRVVFGEICDIDGKPLGGHCWPMYKTEMGEWCILENTHGRKPSFLPRRFINIYPFLRYVPYYCFNNHHLFRIFPKKGELRKYSSLNQYFSNRNGKVNITNTSLAPGGILSMTIGHFDVTAEVMKAHGFGVDAVHVAADASQDPDFYDFNTPAAHAQTNDFKGTPSPEIKRNAIEQYKEWVREKTDAIQIAAANSPKDGLFFLGYTLHAIEDLAAHRGITNEQHSYLAHANRSPDEENSRINKAKEYAYEYLKFFKEKHPTCFDKLRSYETQWWRVYDKVSMADKKELLGKSWDMTPSTLLAYRNSYSGYNPQTQPIKETEWDCNSVFKEVLGYIKS